MKKIIVGIISLLLLIPVCTVAKATEYVYEDVPTESWYAQSVYYCAEQGLMVGETEQLFSPQGKMTRAMFIVVLYRIAGEPYVELIEDPFTDVRAGSYYENAVKWGIQIGIVTGITPTQYGPREPITRQDAACLLERFLTATECHAFDGKPEAELAYLDAEYISDYAYESVMSITHKSLMRGFPDCTFRPKSNLTRAEAAVLFCKLFRAISE